MGKVLGALRSGFATYAAKLLTPWRLVLAAVAVEEALWGFGRLMGLLLLGWLADVGQKPMGTGWAALFLFLVFGILWTALDPITKVRDWIGHSAAKVRSMVADQVAIERLALRKQFNATVELLEIAHEGKLQLAREAAEVDRVRELWHGAEERACDRMADLIRDAATYRRSRKGDATVSDFNGTANKLVEARARLYGCLEQTTAPNLEATRSALWSTLEQYVRAVCWLNRARKNDTEIDAYLDRDEGRPFTKCRTEHRRLVRVSRLLRGRSALSAGATTVHANMDRILFDFDQ